MNIEDVLHPAPRPVKIRPNYKMLPGYTRPDYRQCTYEGHIGNGHGGPVIQGKLGDMTVRACLRHYEWQAKEEGLL